MWQHVGTGQNRSKEGIDSMKTENITEISFYLVISLINITKNIISN